jgi:hypothetical protein
MQRTIFVVCKQRVGVSEFESRKGLNKWLPSAFLTIGSKPIAKPPI